MAPGTNELGVEELERLRPGLRMMALRALGNAEAAEEAAQETLARAVVALREGRPSDPQKVGAFVAGIARHVIAKAYHARQRLVPLDAMPHGAPATGMADPLTALVSALEHEAVHAALARLSPGDRALLRLAFFEGLTPAAVAARLGEPPERIRKRKSRALQRLRAAFLGAGGHEAKGSAT